MGDLIELRDLIAGARSALESVPEIETIDDPSESFEAVTRRRRRTLEISRVQLRVGELDAIATRKFQLTDAAKHTRAWLQGDDTVLVLCGPVGTGKTFAAAAALAHVGRGRCIQAPDLARHMDPWQSDRDAGFEPLRVRDYSLLILDDLGTERDDDTRWRPAFARFIDNVMSTGTRCIITSNLRRKQFRDRYDERVIDRLNHIGRAVEIAGKSLRKGQGGL